MDTANGGGPAGSLVVIDYGMGNLGSIVNMLKKAGVRAAISSDPSEIAAAAALILPGVGAFDAGMRNLDERGLTPVLNARVLEHRVPILGLCLGMQLFTRRSEEGVRPGLGWIDAETKRFKLPSMRVPHMGWNYVSVKQADGIFDRLEPGSRFYFVHSYYVDCACADDVMTTTQYGFDFASAVRRRNIVGTQFHPEKSHKFGLRLMRNFVEQCGLLPCSALA